MKMSKNGRKTQKAIRRALMLGLPVAGLLLTAGCDRSTPKAKESNENEEHCTIGKIVLKEDDIKYKFGGDSSKK